MDIDTHIGLSTLNSICIKLMLTLICGKNVENKIPDSVLFERTKNIINNIINRNKINFKSLNKKPYPIYYTYHIDIQLSFIIKEHYCMKDDEKTYKKYINSLYTHVEIFVKHYEFSDIKHIIGTLDFAFDLDDNILKKNCEELKTQIINVIKNIIETKKYFSLSYIFIYVIEDYYQKVYEVNLPDVNFHTNHLNVIESNYHTKSAVEKAEAEAEAEAEAKAKADAEVEAEAKAKADAEVEA